LAHGTNDAQKTMGVITLALIADHRLAAKADPPAWVIIACAVAIAAGTYFGGWRVIRTMGHRITHIEPPQGFTAQTAAAAVLLTATQGGLPLSTTHITSGAVLGAGTGRVGARVRWRVAGSMVVAWVLTLPAAALLLLGVWAWSHRHPVNADNVNEVTDPPEPPVRQLQPPVLQQRAS